MKNKTKQLTLFQWLKNVEKITFPSRRFPAPLPLTCGSKSMTQIFPASRTVLTASILVPYRYPLYSPYSSILQQWWGKRKMKEYLSFKKWNLQIQSSDQDWMIIKPTEYCSPLLFPATLGIKTITIHVQNLHFLLIMVLWILCLEAVILLVNVCQLHTTNNFLSLKISKHLAQFNECLFCSAELVCLREMIDA